MLRHKGTFFKGTADTDSHHHGRTGVWPRVPDSRQNGLLNAFNAVCRLQHEHSAHIFAAEALGSHSDLHLVSLHDLIMKDSRRIITCVYTVDGILHHGFS